MDNWYEEMEQAEQEYDAMQYELARSYEEGYRQGIAKGQKEHEEFCKACIHKVSKSDIDALQETAREDAIDEIIIKILTIDYANMTKDDFLYGICHLLTDLKEQKKYE